MSNNVLVIGSGGREHALAWKLSQSQSVGQIYVSPGNAGTHFVPYTSNVSLDIKDHAGLLNWCKENKIDLVVVGPEDPLAAGIVDVLQNGGVACFGPSASAARIEADKEFAKQLMVDNDIPTALYRTFSDLDEALLYINAQSEDNIVVKACGLAAGKGVIVATSKKEACIAATDMLKNNKFGSAGSSIIIEEFLTGEEVSCLSLVDGENVMCFPSAQDHKRLLDGDKGPNTGGMGAYSPCNMISSVQMESIKKNIIKRTVQAMKAMGCPYKGCLYTGLILTDQGPKVLEYNCRFGDPETQVLLPILNEDLFTLLKYCVDGNLPVSRPMNLFDRVAVAVVAISEGYPNSYSKGIQISGLSRLRDQPGVLIFHAGTILTNGKTYTNGGRVLSCVCVDTDVKTSARKCLQAVETVQFQGRQNRRDIAHKAIDMCISVTYSDSGVDIAAGDQLVNSIKAVVASTARAGCCRMFGGVFDLKAAGCRDPLLISGTDGVGTKLKIAQSCGLHETVGIDLVAMCVNDILCHGAEPLFFLDYFACGRLDIETTQKVIAGIAEGCKMSGCTLLGGETAEMPGMYTGDKYDLAGFAVGSVERGFYLPRSSDIQEGDMVIGLASSGVHSNGFSLVRHLLERFSFDFNDPCPFNPNVTIGKMLLEPTKIYVKSLLPILATGRITALAHITGGGLPGNANRVLSKNLSMKLDALSWRIPKLFGWLASLGNIDPNEMLRTFNCGVGMILIVAQSSREHILEQLEAMGEEAFVIGQVFNRKQGKDQVEIVNMDLALKACYTKPASLITHVDSESLLTAKRRHVAVLISGNGTNLQALIDYTENVINKSSAKISLVISNKPNVKGLGRAKAAGINTMVISHKDYKSREQFDSAMNVQLKKEKIEFICLAGFMRIISDDFVKEWRGRLINIHPSLLPSFRGTNVHQRVLDSGVRLSGCSVHFVSEVLDAGAIIVQKCVDVENDDTTETLASRVLTVEHQAYPQALELLTSGKAVLNSDGDKIKWN